MKSFSLDNASLGVLAHLLGVVRVLILSIQVLISFYLETLLLVSSISFGIFVSLTVVCEFPFPQNDVIVCSCLHVYHPWCARMWFENNATCAMSGCGLVHPNWFTSFGFGELNAELQQEVGVQNIDLSR